MRWESLLCAQSAGFLCLCYPITKLKTSPDTNRMRAIATRHATMRTTATRTLAPPHTTATPQRDPHPHRTCVV